MSDPMDLEQRLRRHYLAADDDRPANDGLDEILALIARTTQRPAWSYPGRWLPTVALPGSPLASGGFAWATLLLLCLVVVAMTAGGMLVGSPLAHLMAAPPRSAPSISGPARNGSIAFSAGGDIYVGDPNTGEATAIVTGPEDDSSPKFSPDGSRIAFVRGGSSADPSVVVVQADGSDPRVVTPVGFAGRGFGAFAWTPDGGSIAINHDARRGPSGGYLSLVSASGAPEPRLLTPPLPRWPGGWYFNPYAQVAPMLRPPSADRILSGDYHALYEFDGDLKHRTQLAADALAHFEPYGVSDPAYSPDGSMIAFELDRVAGEQWTETIGTYLMKADGTDLRKLSSGPGWIASWSPDGVAVALERWTTEPDRKDVIVVVNAATGAERVLDATAVDHKGPFEPDFQGWSWSPDGRGIVFLESPGDHPNVVDVATGDVTELPWTADSGPSWQRVP